MTKMNNQDAARIRTYLDHGIGTRRVRVHRNGRVTLIGSQDHADRSQDFRAFAGYADELLIEAKRN